MTTNVATEYTTFQIESPEGQGTAFLVESSSNVYVVTAFHVVGVPATGQWHSDDSPEGDILVVDGERLPLEPVVADGEADLALLRPRRDFEDRLGQDVAPSSFHEGSIESDAPWRTRAYPDAHAGSPCDLGGNIRGLDRERDLRETIQLLTDEARFEWPGVSGSPILHERRVVGVVTRKDGGAEVGWGVPVQVLGWLIKVADSGLAAATWEFLAAEYPEADALQDVLSKHMQSDAFKVLDGPDDTLHSVVVRNLLSRAGADRDCLGQVLSTCDGPEAEKLRSRWSELKDARREAIASVFTRSADDERESRGTSDVNRVTRFEFDGSWCESGGVEHCIVQTRWPGRSAIEKDDSRPEIVKTLRQLLSADRGRSKLHELVGSRHKPTVVILPELSLGSSDWEQVDQLVRECGTRNLILIVGFGVTEGATITEWAKGASETNRHGCWPEDDPPADGYNYNGGWVWVRRETEDGVEVDCVTFLKNFLNQSVQASTFPRIQEGRNILRIETDDLVIFPLICADLICTRHESPLQRIDESLRENSPASRQEVLLTGSLAQDEYHDAWINRIQTAVQSSDETRILVLANHSFSDMVESEHDRDQWRSLSGVYIHSSEGPDSANFPEVRVVSSEKAVHGRVFRQTEPAVLADDIRWSFGSTTGQNLWTPNRGCRIEEGGGVLEMPSIEPRGYELQRILRRRRLRRDEGDPVPDEQVPEVIEEEVKSLEQKLLKGLNLPSAESLTYTLIFGVESEFGREDRFAPDADGLSEYEKLLGRGLEGILTLLRYGMSVSLSWHKSPSDSGQLIAEEEETSVLVWLEPQLSKDEMVSAIRAWRMGGMADDPECGSLVVLGKLVNSDRELEKESSVALDISRPSRHGESDELEESDGSEHANKITSARDVRFAATLPFKKLGAVLELTGEAFFDEIEKRQSF